MEGTAYGVGIAAVAGLFLVACALGRTTDLQSVFFQMIEGKDRRPSTSKFQFLFWTTFIVFAYTAIYVARAKHGNFSPISDVPNNILIAMGLSGGTLAAAKNITVAQTRQPGTKPQPGAGDPTGLPLLVKDDAGIFDLSKIQMIAWTAIAGAIYLSTIVHSIHSAAMAARGPSTMPDIDTTLMVLMGLGQGGYLAKKLVTPP